VIAWGLDDVMICFTFICEAAWTCSSTMLFQLPQSGHLPTHLGDSYPHDWQTYLISGFGKLGQAFF
jgi:hypothetical protein